MALLTDGNPNDIDALRAYESSILRVTDEEAINLSVKLRLAAEEISQDILDILIDHTTSADPQGLPRRQTGVSDVAVSAPMRRWHALHTLEIVYRDAYNNQLNDRYRLKWEEYEELAGDAREKTFRYGIGLVSNPLPVPQPPQFSTVAGLLLATTYYVQATWIASIGQESAPSKSTTYTTIDGSLITAQLAGAPAGASGWNIYMGLSPWPLALQNSAPLAIGSTFTLSASGLVAGRPPDDGQAPDTYITGGMLMRRG